ncbi:FdhF/YdeP family oxidoreductase [Pseudomonas sp. CCI3.2]|uniref:FdhF/YdeP family oxidoreductase n=1 Tax=unclassified Pseudomonas TaxID=196821 RepID=UPI002AC9BB27|nr:MULTISPECIES: FdhF/YdeP family oxidoreductase [unclassified Pseudomonas]MEB0077391.1 FdhF/YdeP family oxidoreductase [Pseudomonas sp. MH10out]MEB0101154.1 FdhF/YdeP family oxidoreductase [Pseudomonas sp. CCI3.2]MEB0129994.1 FdhF/YdeP family oxidoreductase [Pseudomonas sp. CCI2.4]MEB0157254.1 FdhF/YdeP family oxidoreductase [Pseudomonas sp. AH2 (2023)]MEB0170281.1 FdhF/YdeP family oxidoreductase [Pseudomonas sp. CCC4.4]
MSSHHQADKVPVKRYKPYKGPAGGWGALMSVTQAWLTSDNALKNIRMMLKTNQNGGFDCPGCAWGDSPESGMVKFCENGAKAVNWEATKRRVDASFFARYSVSALREQSDYWLEYQGRLTEPMSYDAETDRYKPISWENAFALISHHLRNLPSPDMAEFYTSGRASNEAAYLYQLFVRSFGTNNFPDCSNMCHEASGVALAQSVGVGKGTVTFADFEHADAIFILGQNPGTNHPRMLEPLREAVLRGAQVVCVNPLKERGLERFQHPQHPLEMLSNGSEPTSTAYLRPALGGDMALLRGMAKYLLQWEREAQAANAPPVFDHDFLNEHTDGVLDYLASIDDTSWEEIVQQSGLPLTDIETAARMYAKGTKVIMCWAMGITQHRHSVPTIQEIANLMLLRGNIGKPGAGLCPVRGHSNVQGDRTMGINERPPTLFLDALEKRFQFKMPRTNGHNVVEAIHAMLDGHSKVFIGLGGNFAQATPDSSRTVKALGKCDLTVQISTKLNRSHLTHGKQALILPCFGRTDIDIQADGPQAVTVEDSFSMVHASNGQLQPLSKQMRSEPAIIAGIAAATLGTKPVDWLWLTADYSRIRDLIADTIPGFKDFNERVKHPGGFYLGNAAGERRWNTKTARANFRANVLPVDLVHENVRATGEIPDLIMQSMRSHDQYNTTIYGLDDRYRGVKGQRDVLFANEADIIRLGFKPGQKADLISIWNDGLERRVKGFTLLAFDIPAGQAAAYYPEVNPLVPLESVGDGSSTPTSKFVAIRLETASASARIL